MACTLLLAFAGCNPAKIYQKNAIATAAPKVKVSYSDGRKEDYQAFLDKLNAFAANLTYEVYSDSDRQANLCISPVSVYMALALATECSNGQTREEILNAVGVTYEDVKSFTKTLYAFANREFYYHSITDKEKVSAFAELANSVWTDKTLPLKEQAASNLASNFNCDFFSVDFSGSEGERAIEAYIKDKTHGLVDSDINLPPDTLITLINTFYLKEIWNQYGRELNFTDEKYDFTNADGSITRTKLLMGYYGDGAVYDGEGYTTFFTTTCHGFKIKFILPDEGKTIEDVFTPQNVYTVNNITDYGTLDSVNMLRHHTRVFFPEYEADFDGDLSDILKQDFGINKLFDVNGCDFSSITDAPIYCDAVIHKCNLKVTDKGIEGAAVTVMPGAGAAGPDEYTDVYHDYIIDRAFGFVLTDTYGAVLFSGVVNKI